MSSDETERPCLAFVGGTGPEGRGLATRFAHAGFPVIVGSRSADRGHEVARKLAESLPDATISGADNLSAATSGDIVLFTIPYTGLDDTLPPLRSALGNKIVISTIAPVEFVDGRPVARHLEDGSAAEQVQRQLPGSRVVSAFQTVDAHSLLQLEEDIDTDVLVCSDDAEARHAVVRLASSLPGVRGLSGGRLSHSRYAEEFTAMLIIINRIYKVHSGLRITGVNR